MHPRLEQRANRCLTERIELFDAKQRMAISGLDKTLAHLRALDREHELSDLRPVIAYFADEFDEFRSKLLAIDIRADSLDRDLQILLYRVDVLSEFFQRFVCRLIKAPGPGH